MAHAPLPWRRILVTTPGVARNLRSDTGSTVPQLADLGIAEANACCGWSFRHQNVHLSACSAFLNEVVIANGNLAAGGDFVPEAQGDGVGHHRLCRRHLLA
ncbi:MAG: hypothetical protein J0H40_17035 [Rhizobiales bacterium]|nr:hypothetical protein [Hyphomicrobiales bacterium]